MIEHIILDEPHEMVQKKFNQWRHQYALCIMVVRQSTSNPDYTYAYVTRNESPPTKKGDKS